MKHAVIATGGKQYVVAEGDVISIEKLSRPLGEEVKLGDSLTFDEVLMSSTGSDTKVGTPTVSGAKVSGEVTEIGRAKKILVMRTKAKSNFMKRNGHRQPFIKVKIKSIA